MKDVLFAIAYLITIAIGVSRNEPDIRSLIFVTGMGFFFLLLRGRS